MLMLSSILDLVLEFETIREQRSRIRVNCDK